MEKGFVLDFFKENEHGGRVFDKSVTINAIDTSNAEYDVLTLSAAITGLAKDDVIVEADGRGRQHRLRVV